MKYEYYISYCPFCGGKVTMKDKKRCSGICTNPNCGAEFETKGTRAKETGIGMISVSKPPKKTFGKKRIMAMKPVLERNFKNLVWVNPTTERLRDKECLCLNCGRLNKNPRKNCPHAGVLYVLCVAANIALAVTRCPEWMPPKKK